MPAAPQHPKRNPRKRISLGSIVEEQGAWRSIIGSRKTGTTNQSVEEHGYSLSGYNQ
jgi:hypothetical protein